MEVRNKDCTNCGISKLLGDFSKHVKGKYGCATSCKVCSNAYSRSRAKDSKDGSYISSYNTATRSAKFLTDAKKIHGDSFSYSDTVYAKSKTLAKFYCNKHRLKFSTTPAFHLRAKGGGCTLCRYDCSGKSNSTTLREFILKAKEVHGGKYDYSRVEYKTAFTKVTIRCIAHDKYFEQLAGDHLGGQGCQICARALTVASKLLTQDQFIERALALESNYSYDKAKYIKQLVPMTVVCPTHGDFSILPKVLFRGSGCPDCATTGYSNLSPGSIYLLKSGNVTKIGITNRKVPIRVIEINRSSGKIFQPIWSHLFNLGLNARSLESEIKDYLDLNYEAVEEKHDGSTECYLDVDRQKLLLMLQQRTMEIGRLNGIN